MDLYDLVQFGYVNQNDDVVQMLKQNFDKEVVPPDIREYEWNEQADAFWDKAGQDTKIQETIKNPKKNNRRIHIEDAQVKHFHNRFFTDDERYYEYSEGDQDPTDTPTEDEYYANTTQSQRDSKPTYQKIGKK